MPNSIQCSLTFLKTKGFLTVNLTFEQLKKKVKKYIQRYAKNYRKLNAWICSSSSFLQF